MAFRLKCTPFDALSINFESIASRTPLFLCFCFQNVNCPPPTAQTEEHLILVSVNVSVKRITLEKPATVSMIHLILFNSVFNFLINAGRRKKPCHTKMCAFRCLISRAQNQILRSSGKLLLRKLCFFRGRSFSQCFILSTALHIRIHYCNNLSF